MLTFMRQIRLAHPARRRIYWVEDNLSASWTPPIRAFAAAHHVRYRNTDHRDRRIAAAEAKHRIAA